MLAWRLVGRGTENPQILAPDGKGGVLAINRVMTTGQPEKWWLTGPNYGIGSEHAAAMGLLSVRSGIGPLEAGGTEALG